MSQTGLIGYGIALWISGFCFGALAGHYIYKYWQAYKKYTKPEFIVKHPDDWERIKG